MVGERVVIRPIERSDLPIVVKWWNDPEVMYYANDNPDPHKTLQELEIQYDNEKGEWASYMERFVIETNNGQLIGDIMYHGYRSDIKSVRLGVFIGEKAYWGRGLGTEAIRLFLGYLFEYKKVHKVELTVSAFNHRAIRAFGKCGFSIDGVLRDNAIINGNYVDHILMSILDREYFEIFG